MVIQQWWMLQYLAAGAYVAIMVAVLGVPQLLSSFIDIRERRRERQEAEANAERRHQEEQRRSEERYLEEQHRRQEEQRRSEERHLEEQRIRQEEQRRSEERHLEEQRIRQEEQRRGEERYLEEQRRSEERHLEMMTLLAGLLGNGGNRSQDDMIRAQQQLIDHLQTDNDRLRRERGNDHNGQEAFDGTEDC